MISTDSCSDTSLFQTQVLQKNPNKISSLQIVTSSIKNISTQKAQQWDIPPLQKKNDAEAAEARDRMMRLRKMGQGEAPSSTVRKKARGGKIKGYKYGGKACRGRKANYKA